jgi:hypothetical protein
MQVAILLRCEVVCSRIRVVCISKDAMRLMIKTKIDRDEMLDHLNCEILVAKIFRITIMRPLADSDLIANEGRVNGGNLKFETRK